MAEQVRLTRDGQRALREAENLCWRTNVAIEAPEHLLAGALLALGDSGTTGLPDRARIEEALLLVCGAGSEPLHDRIVPSPTARAALDHAVRRVLEAGSSELGAREIARGVIESGEVNPLFYSGLGIDRRTLLERIG